MAEPNGYIEGSNGERIEIVDSAARESLKTKLPAPKTAKAGDYLRISAINEDGSMLVEAVSAPGVELPTEATFAHITLETAQTADGECGVIIHPEGTEDVPELTFYGMRGDEAVRLNNVADAVDDRSVPNLGQVKNLVQKNGNDSGQNAELTAEQEAALEGLMNVTAFTKKDVSAEIAAFREAFGLDGGDDPEEPVDPEEPAKTLASISATYSGGPVPVGTVVTALTGVTVTAHYSDGSSAVVTGYTLSGIIAEGSNTITVQYSGMTATFVVTGVAVSGGDGPVMGDGWTDGVPYELTLIENEYSDRKTGEFLEYSGWTRTDYTPCFGVSKLSPSVFTSIYENGSNDNVFYDADKKYISSFMLAHNGYPISVPANAYYFVMSHQDNVMKSLTVIPHAPEG